MEGVSDAVLRELLGNLGCMSFCATEFMRVTLRPVSRRVVARECPELATGGYTQSGVPVFVQLRGGNAGPMADSAAMVADLGAYGVDLNFGCPARKVNGHDGGAALLKAPLRVETVVRSVRDAVPSHVPVSAKIRLGWENPDDVVDLALAAEAGGASFVTIHGRTKVQMYKGTADWERIGRAVKALKIPVVANGDITSPESLARCQAVTGASMFMLGRGAFARPNLFRWLRGQDSAPWDADRCMDLMRLYVDRLQDDPRFDRPDRAALARLKQWLRAQSDAEPALKPTFDRAKRAQTLPDALAIVDEMHPPRATATRAQDAMLAATTSQ